jgi:hypothetical protein
MILQVNLGACQTSRPLIKQWMIMAARQRSPEGLGGLAELMAITDQQLARYLAYMSMLHGSFDGRMCHCFFFGLSM